MDSAVENINVNIQRSVHTSIYNAFKRYTMDYPNMSHLYFLGIHMRLLASVYSKKRPVNSEIAHGTCTCI